jgi:hypothetical protein
MSWLLDLLKQEKQRESVLVNHASLSNELPSQTLQAAREFEVGENVVVRHNALYPAAIPGVITKIEGDKIHVQLEKITPEGDFQKTDNVIVTDKDHLTFLNTIMMDEFMGLHVPKVREEDIDAALAKVLKSSPIKKAEQDDWVIYIAPTNLTKYRNAFGALLDQGLISLEMIKAATMDQLKKARKVTLRAHLNHTIANHQVQALKVDELSPQQRAIRDKLEALETQLNIQEKADAEAKELTQAKTFDDYVLHELDEIAKAISQMKTQPTKTDMPQQAPTVKNTQLSRQGDQEKEIIQPKKLEPMKIRPKDVPEEMVEKVKMADEKARSMYEQYQQLVSDIENAKKLAEEAMAQILKDRQVAEKEKKAQELLMGLVNVLEEVQVLRIGDKILALIKKIEERPQLTETVMNRIREMEAEMRAAINEYKKRAAAQMHQVIAEVRRLVTFPVRESSLAIGAAELPRSASLQSLVQKIWDYVKAFAQRMIDVSHELDKLLVSLEAKASLQALPISAQELPKVPDSEKEQSEKSKRNITINFYDTDGGDVVTIAPKVKMKPTTQEVERTTSGIPMTPYIAMAEKVKYKFGDPVELIEDPKKKGIFLDVQNSKSGDIDLLIYWLEPQIEDYHVVEESPLHVRPSDFEVTEEMLEQAKAAYKQWKEDMKEYKKQYKEEYEQIVDDKLKRHKANIKEVIGEREDIDEMHEVTLFTGPIDPSTFTEKQYRQKLREGYYDIVWVRVVLGDNDDGIGILETKPLHALWVKPGDYVEYKTLTTQFRPYVVRKVEQPAETASVAKMTAKVSRI